MTERRALSIDALSLATDGVLLSDGTLWSHAATLGKRKKGDAEFEIDRAFVENCVRIFCAGYPQKVPFDYDHALVSDDPEVRRAAAQGKVPKAGSAKDMVGVFAVDDFTGDLKTTAVKLAAKAGRELDDPRNFGLWVRWEPTLKALQSIQAQEYTELSITFTEHCIHNSTGEDQGPAILAIAVTNFPFLDDMLPVAASRHDRITPTPAAPDTSITGAESMKTLLASLATLAGVAVNTEEEAVQKVSVIGDELKTLRTQVADRARQQTEAQTSLTAVQAELGVSDGKTAVERVRQLKAENERHAQAAAAAKKAQVDAQVKAIMTKYEKRITPALRDDFYAPALRAELENDVEIAKSKTVQALEALKPHGITDRSAGPDIDSESLGGDQDALLDKRARALLTSDAELKQIAEKDWSKAYDLAVDRVAKEINYRSPQMERAATATA